MEVIIGKIESIGYKLLGAIIIYFVGREVIRLLEKAIDKAIEKSPIDETLKRFALSASHIILNVILFYVIYIELGFDTASIVALLGTAGLAAGLAVQGALSNFAGGVIILLTRPFKCGDYIICPAGEGTVLEIGMIATKLLTVDKKTVIIPNGSLAGANITNCSASKYRRIDIDTSVSYKADLEKAKDVIANVYASNSNIVVDTAEGLENCTYVKALGASEVVIGAWGFVENAKYWTTRWQLIENIKLELDKAGIEIPYQQIDVHIDKQ